SGVVQNSALGPVDQGFGFLFGVARGVLLVLIAFLVYEQVFGGSSGIAAVDQSQSRILLADLGGELAEGVPSEAPGMIARYYETLPSVRQYPPAQGSVNGVLRQRDIPAPPAYTALARPARVLPMANFPSRHPFDPEDDKPREECGVFGAIGAQHAATFVALGLHALQHRGQEAAGIVSYAPHVGFSASRRFGYVRDNFTSKAVIDRLPGNLAIGHVRYSTAGSKGHAQLRDVQPLFAEFAM